MQHNFFPKKEKIFFKNECAFCAPAHSHPTAIHPSIPDTSSTLPSPAVLQSSFLPSYLSIYLLSSPTAPPQITAVFTGALRDLPTRPRVRSHPPHQAKKKPTQILAGKLPAPSHTPPAAFVWTHGNAVAASCSPTRQPVLPYCPPGAGFRSKRIDAMPIAIRWCQ